MKKFLIVLVVIITLLLVSAYIEINYCHSWTTVRDPMILNGIPDEEYWPNTVFCKMNSIPGLIGGLGIEAIKDIVDLLR